MSKTDIRQKLVPPYILKQNGCCVRENMTVVETAQTMMHAQKKLQALWREMVNITVYILNCTGPSGIKGKWPQKLWIRKIWSIKHLWIIGCTCFAYISRQNCKKINRKAVKDRLVRYDNNDDYHIWYIKDMKNTVKN